MKVEAKIKFHSRQECFTHKDDNGTVRTFPIQTMREFVNDYPSCADLIHTRIPIDPKTVQFIKEKMGIEQDRLDRLVDPYLHQPAIGILWECGRITTIIDGNHRMVKLHELGETKIRIHLFQRPLWEHFILPVDVGADVFTRRSNMIEFERGEL